MKSNRIHQISLWDFEKIPGLDYNWGFTKRIFPIIAIVLAEKCCEYSSLSLVVILFFCRDRK